MVGKEKKGRGRERKERVGKGKKGRGRKKKT